jgi:hypothetical protein
MIFPVSKLGFITKPEAKWLWIEFARWKNNELEPMPWHSRWLIPHLARDHRLHPPIHQQAHSNKEKKM